MKKHLPFFLILAAALFPLVVSAQPAPSGWNTTITSAAGGTKTAFSISSFGNTAIGWALPGTNNVTSWSVAVSGASGSPAGAWTMDFTNFTIPVVGVLTNLQSFESRIVDTIIFSSFNGAQYLLLGTSESALQVTTNQFWNLVLDPSVAEFEIDLAFNNFTPGTYNTTDPGPISNMEIVPEPSTYALLALSAAGLGGYVLRRRRK